MSEQSETTTTMPVTTWANRLGEQEGELGNVVIWSCYAQAADGSLIVSHVALPSDERPNLSGDLEIIERVLAMTLRNTRPGYEPEVLGRYVETLP